MPGATVATTLYAYAAPTPRPISVHMFGFPVRIESMQRRKNGAAAHNTTGVASTSSNHVRTVLETAGARRCPAMPEIATRIVSGSVHQKRRRKSTISGFSPSSSDGITGSSAMPQIGQLPGALRRISGCIGHV